MSSLHHSSAVVSTFDPRKEKPLGVPLPDTAEAIARLRVCLIRTAWNENLVTSLADQTRAQLVKAGVAEANVVAAPAVAGSYELPYAAKRWAESGAFDVILCFGVLIKGETLHFECISNAVAQGLMDAQLSTGVPVIYGVLNCLTLEQAEARCGKVSPLPTSLALTAINMAALRTNSLPSNKARL
ncbi:6,7dimethyl-8-ribityllumazine synthase [Acanthamoeba castellanii str. Neff]|uniref:6,7-dimethyl-8-ribityllumazine synthase n=1 Tax=Acanthamoeba castellanii (strain ATCC 30010 / Neff) TaxID=1257118 RepID=L8GN89_ACACF|nr:6,7dimethyl-8-ribityllumazine synthase [Acanthamoeba castellanii str. Neff]ELR14530.1 6,7dimethyl-8-ribityllumazine synthase [Acanthamoeba castellanii str. Neff]